MSEGKNRQKATKKAADKRKDELNFFQKVLNFFKRLPKLIASPFRTPGESLKR